MRYYYAWWKHRLTCFRCHPNHITGMNRAQQGRANTSDVGLIALIVVVLVIVIIACIGYLLKGG